jgi:hypothetical protein
MRFDGPLTLVPALTSPPVAKVILFDGEDLVAPSQEFFDATEAEIAAIPVLRDYVPDTSEVKSPNCDRWWTQTIEDDHKLDFKCTLPPRHDGDHQALAPDDSCKASRPKRAYKSTGTKPAAKKAKKVPA